MFFFNLLFPSSSIFFSLFLSLSLSLSHTHILFLSLSLLNLLVTSLVLLQLPPMCQLCIYILFSLFLSSFLVKCSVHFFSDISFLSNVSFFYYFHFLSTIFTYFVSGFGCSCLNRLYTVELKLRGSE